MEDMAMEQKRKEKGLEIDLSEHKNPQQFLDEMQKRFPDPNISLILKGSNLQIIVLQQFHPQFVVAIYSNLSYQAKCAIYGPPRQ